MFALQAPRTEPRSITKRRNHEAHYNNFSRIIAQDQRQAQIANWEINSTKMIERNTIANMARGIEEQEQSKLQERQRRIAELYRQDEAQQKAELANLRETPAQKATRMVAQARKLKAAREEKRRQFAQQMYNRQWREGCDDLRLIDSHNFARHCREQIADQRFEKAQKKLHEQRVESQWANIWENERLKRVQDEEEQKRRRQRFNHETKTALLGQMEVARQRNLQEAHQKEVEREAFRRQLEEDCAHAKAAQERLLHQRRSAMDGIVQFNEQQQRTKAEVARLKREQELKELHEQKQAAAADDARKAEERRQRARDMQKYMSYVEEYKREEQEIERTIERLTMEEMARANKKQDAQWSREQQAREALMADVYEQRALQLHELEARRNEIEAELEEERRLVEQEARAAEEAEQNEDTQYRAKCLQQQADILRQMQEKRNNAKIQEALIVEDRENAIEAERRYRAFVAREKRAAGHRA